MWSAYECFYRSLFSFIPFLFFFLLGWTVDDVLAPGLAISLLAVLLFYFVSGQRVEGWS